MADVGAFTGHGSGWFAGPVAKWARHARLTPVLLSRIALLLALCAALWFTEGRLRGALTGSLLLAAVVFTDAVAAELRRHGGRDALEVWLAAVLSRLREYTVYAGLAIGGAVTGVPDAWAWASGALIALALHDTVVAARGAPAGTGPEPPGARNGPLPGARGSPIDAVDPSRAADRSPSDPSLTAELFGAAEEDTDADTGSGTHREPIRIRTMPTVGEVPGWEKGRQRALRALRGQKRRAQRTRGSGKALPRVPLMSGLPVFPQAGRFAVVALTITIWDTRVTFIALIVGCALAVSSELIEHPARDAAR
ncbi:MAG: hypothetical protein M0026_09465 [Nocardiopsaceae bacterium]|nr:hypothetical protein [Nocardiopsaceae bacterium]